MSLKQDRENIARTAALFASRAAARGFSRDYVDDAAMLHSIASKLHRWSERQCNEDLTCPACRGDGYVAEGKDAPCHKCAGRGNTLGRREHLNELRAKSLAELYGFRLYVQGDPRGCPLYLIPTESIPLVDDAESLSPYIYEMEKRNGDFPTGPSLQSRWIASNYNRGVAICHVGR